MTLTVIVEPLRLALTTTPSIGPSACDETIPVNAWAADWAAVPLVATITNRAVEIAREIVKRLLRIISRPPVEGPHNSPPSRSALQRPGRRGRPATYIIPASEYGSRPAWRSVMKKFAWLLFGGIVGLSLSLQAQQTPADIILTNGKIITVNDTFQIAQAVACLLYTSDAADERSSVDLGGRRI